MATVVSKYNVINTSHSGGSGGRANIIFIWVSPHVWTYRATATETEAHVVDLRLAREEGTVSPLPYWLGSKLGAIIAHLLDSVPTPTTGLQYMFEKSRQYTTLN